MERNTGKVGDFFVNPEKQEPCLDDNKCAEISRHSCYFQHVRLGPRDAGSGAVRVHTDGLVRTERSVRKASGRHSDPAEDAHSEGLRPWIEDSLTNVQGDELMAKTDNSFWCPTPCRSFCRNI